MSTRTTPEGVTTIAQIRRESTGLRRRIARIYVASLKDDRRPQRDA